MGEEMREPAAKSAPPTLPQPERESISVEAARRLILESVEPLGPETLPLVRAVGRVLLEPIRADRRLPPLDNSAMDGFALRAEDATKPGATLEVVEDLPAGRRTDRKLGPREAARIIRVVVTMDIYLHVLSGMQEDRLHRWGRFCLA